MAKSSCQFHEGLQHCPQIESRPADDLEHVCGSSLLLQRFSQFGQQADVLDGNDRLVGEVLHEFDLLVGEGAWLLPVNGKRTNQLVLF